MVAKWNRRSIIINMALSPHYAGSKVFHPIATAINLPVDQLNYVVAQFVAVFLGVVIRFLLPHSLNRPTWRYLYCLSTGFAILWFLIGWMSWLVLFQVAVSYLIMLFAPPSFQALIVFYFAIGYMLAMYLWRLTVPFDYLCYDATYPLMITTQKLTTLAFSLSDWKKLKINPERAKTMDEERQKWALRDVPGPLEFMSFLFAFQGVLAGPFCHYKTYRAFIEGNSMKRKEEDEGYVETYLDDPGTCWVAVTSKLLAVFLWILITMFVKPHFPDSLNVDPDFITSHGYVYRLVYLWFSLFFHRAKYYVTWIIADAAYNASGMGYVGKTKDGKADWSGMTNVHVLQIETSTSLKVYLDNWNIRTTHWLRHVCYSRVPFQRTLLTFLLSALWHGLFLCYYLTFLSAAVFVEAGRRIRTNIRPLFQSTVFAQRVYAVLTYLGTQLGLSFLVLSFVILHLEPSIRFHNSFFWFFHISAVLIVVILPGKKGPRPPPLKQQQQQQQSKQQQQQQKRSEENGNDFHFSNERTSLPQGNLHQRTKQEINGGKF